jgi:hypothetical protein
VTIGNIGKVAIPKEGIATDKNEEQLVSDIAVSEMGKVSDNSQSLLRRPRL